MPATSQYAQTLIKNYGWSRARDIAAVEAAPHSPSGNQDGFWTCVLAAIEDVT